MKLKLKERFKKIGEKIKGFFKKVVDKIKEFVQKEGREILKATASIGVDACVIGVTLIGLKLGSLQYMFSIRPIGIVLAWGGAIGLSFLLTHMIDKYVDEEMDDLFESVEELHKARQEMEEEIAKSVRRAN